MSKAMCIDGGFEYFTRKKDHSDVLVVDSKYSDFSEHTEEIFDFLNLNLKNKSVLLKPNLLWPSEPEQGLNTHPAIMEAVVKECEKRGASKVLIGDNAGQIMYGNSKGAFYGSGLGEKLGKYYVNLGIDLEPHYLKSIDTTVYISKVLKEVDFVINLPKFKTHKLTGITASIKNTFGYLPGAQKAKSHIIAGSHERFGQALAEIHAIRKPDAQIVDAILGMQGNGASSKDLKYIGKILASTDPVALDSIVAKMMGMEPEKIWHLKYAQEMGLGSMKNVNVVGQWDKIEDFLLAPGFADPSKLRATVTSEGLEKDASRMNPVIDKEKCIKCGECIKECPANALVMEDYPVEIVGKCVSCHACQEICKQRALVLGATL